MQSKITDKYTVHNQAGLCQGDIFRDVKFKYIDNTNEAIEINLSYSLLISQDCDLERIASYKPTQSDTVEFNQFLPNVLLLAAFPSEEVKNGTYLIDLFQK